MGRSPGEAHSFQLVGMASPEDLGVTLAKTLSIPGLSPHLLKPEGRTRSELPQWICNPFHLLMGAEIP